MADSTQTEKTYTKAELDAALADQLAQLKSSLLGSNLLGFAGMGTGPGGGFPGSMPGSLNVPPQGFVTTPGAGTFGPQGVLFAGGSPWPVSSRPADIFNAIYGIKQGVQGIPDIVKALQSVKGLF